MDIRGKTICGLAAIRVRDALVAFIGSPVEIDFSGALPKIAPKELKSRFLSDELHLTVSQGRALLKCLITSGYVDGARLIPTSLGMALANARSRPRLDRKGANALLKRFISAVKTANRRPGARVLIKEVRIFGSMLSSTPAVGDIDLIVTMQLPDPDDLQPEDIIERNRLASRILVSRYISLHDELDFVAGTARSRIIYRHRGGRRNTRQPDSPGNP